MCSVSFYTNSNYKGSKQTFNGPQAQAEHLPNGIDSLKTQSGTWLIVYSDKDYSGDYMKIGPSSNYDDLNHVKRGSSGDWKNQIQSFAMYAAEPSFWNNGSNLLFRSPAARSSSQKMQTSWETACCMIALPMFRIQ